MIIDDRIKDEKRKNGIKRDAAKISSAYHQAKLISINILQVKKYFLLIKNK